MLSIDTRGLEGLGKDGASPAPALAARGRSEARGARGGRPPCDVLLHGDLHLSNVVVRDGELVPIDMEFAGFGDLPGRMQ